VIVVRFGWFWDKCFGGIEVAVGNIFTVTPLTFSLVSFLFFSRPLFRSSYLHKNSIKDGFQIVFTSRVEKMYA